MKKAQIPSNFLRYSIAVIILVAILIFGYSTISSFGSKSCSSNLEITKEKLKATIWDMTSQVGSITKETFAIPCKVDKIMFVDIDRDVSFSPLLDYPIMHDSITSGVKENIFFLRGGEIVDSVYADNVYLENPYYNCFQVRSSKIEATFEGHGKDTKVYKLDSRYDCTYSIPNPIELDTEDLTDILEEIQEEWDDEINESRVDACILEREFTELDGETRITITNQNCNVSFFESIPKCAIRYLQEAINNGEINLSGIGFYVNITDDPLIMWSFTPDETEKFYEIKEDIKENCKRQFVSVAINTTEDPVAQAAAAAALSGTTIATQITALRGYFTAAETIAGTSSSTLNHGLNDLDFIERKVDKALDTTMPDSSRWSSKLAAEIRADLIGGLYEDIMTNPGAYETAIDNLETSIEDIVVPEPGSFTS